MFKKGIFGILGNTHVFNYPIILYLRINTCSFESMDMGRLRWNNGLNERYNPSKYCGIIVACGV